MSKYLNVIGLLGLFFLCQNEAIGQCPEEAGLFCDPSVTFGAPILCDLDCLDGFTATMPDTTEAPQPTILCSTGGSADNMSWFAFVAGADSISLTVTPSNCNTIITDNGIVYSNIQAGIYESCDISADPIVCHNPCFTNGDTPGPATLAVGDLIPGQTYYFYVDGCGGTVCDYEITVNWGNQPFEILDPDGITSGSISDGDTICTGYINLDLVLGNVTPNVNYHWRVSPPITDMIDTDADGFGEFPDVTKDSIEVSFTVIGDYQFFAFSDNDCDHTDTVYFNLFVRDTDPVVFDSVEICGEEFGSYIGPFQTINGEPLSWMSGVINTPGLSSGIVTTTDGCSYEESVFVSQIPSPRQPVDLFVCNGDYPFDYNGITFNGPSDGVFYVMGKATTGCDSMVDISLIDVSASGTFGAGVCDQGNASIIFTLTNVQPSNYNAITYFWEDLNGLVVDTDGIDSILQVSSSGLYTLNAVISTDTNSCQVVLGQYDIDIDDIRPSAPIFINPSPSFCDGNGVGTYSIATDGTETVYDWYLSGDDSINFPSASSVQLDWDSTQSREICVSVLNDCGVSDTICHTVSILPIPTITFTSQDTICVSDVLELNYTGDPGANLAWNTDGGVLAEINPNEFTIEWSIPGAYTIALSGSLDGCSDTIVMKDIIVEEEPNLSSFTCFEFADQIQFVWDAVDCANTYILDTNGVVVYQGTNLNYRFENLSEGQMISANLQVLTDCACGISTSVQSSCTAQGCPTIDITLDGEFGFLCSDEVAATIQYTAIVVGGTGNGTGVWSGDFIDENGLFNTTLSDGGLETFYYTFVDGPCTYVDSVQVGILDNPQLDLEIDDPDCFDDTTGEVDINASGGSGLYTFYINGSETTDFTDVSLSAGNYEIMVVDDQNCGDQEIFEVSIPNQPDLEISGGGDVIIEGSSEVLSINTSEFIGSIIDSILWYASDGTLLCGSSDCESITVSPSVPTNYLVTVYYNGGCVVDAMYSLLVRPETKIVFPTIFAPNGSNIDNHTFGPKSNNPALEVETFQVYDRWGGLMFQSSNFLASDVSFHWDGRYKGQIVQSGVFVYLFKGLDDGKEIIKEGSITVFR